MSKHEPGSQPGSRTPHLSLKSPSFTCMWPSGLPMTTADLGNTAAEKTSMGLEALFSGNQRVAHWHQQHKELCYTQGGRTGGIS